ncbi:MAG TPA: xanthine dehydrogenase family protein molybdopterin-binding subunit [Vicinamibacterales bacterium]|nr:xanthine dehydrogenase family protein molybdopterin-binding subunit [Vicinamibacterales bacterium]
MSDNDRYYIEGPVPETPQPAEAPEPWGETAVIGKPLPRVDAYERVSGSATFPSDVTMPDLLHAAILRCPHAHAMVKKVDIAAAEKMPGVHAVVSGSTSGFEVPWYSTRAGSLSRLFDPHCRYEGDEVAAVAAETPYQAWDAIRAIAVEYDVLPYVVSEERALDGNAPAIHTAGNRAGTPQPYERGDVAKGFAAADVVLEQTYRTACQIHTPTETHGCVARWDGNRLTLWESTQGVYAVQAGVARALKLPLASVRVIGHYMGGGFGSKLGPSKQTIIAALLAKRTARPVKLFVTREESLLCQGNRPPVTMKIKAGVRKDGTLTALELKTLGTGGAYAGVGSVDFQVRDLYLCPHVRTEATDAYTNAGPARAFRAPGHPQGNWALEQMMDALAEAIGMDPVEFRVKNVPTVSQARNNLPYTSTGFKDCLLEGARAFGWKEARRRVKATGHIRRGVGVAGGMWQGGGGSPPSTVIVKLFTDASVNINMGASDNGCGTKTWMAQIVAEELGVPLSTISIEHADTGTTQFATPSGGSKTVPTEAPAGRAAALEVKRQLLALAAEQLKVEAGDLELREGLVVSAKDPAKKLAIGEITGLQRSGLIVGVGYRGPNPEGRAINPFAAHFAEVEVNTLTGEVRLVRYVAAQDSGRVMNRLTYDNQVIGGITMGIGLALTEGRVLDRAHTGKMVNANWHDYKIPTMLDVPGEKTVIAIDPHDAVCNTTGAKGLGEPATVPAASVVANAIYNAIGVRMTDSPISPAAICAALNKPASKSGRKEG